MDIQFKLGHYQPFFAYIRQNYRQISPDKTFWVKITSSSMK
jgi:hypothetical protein